jgi:hypothetical protein
MGMLVDLERACDDVTVIFVQAKMKPYQQQPTKFTVNDICFDDTINNQRSFAFTRDNIY